jgi:hypothetical protein
MLTLQKSYNMYVIKYTGTFGFIKPFNSIRDELIISQKFLTPSIVKGIEKYIFPELISEPELCKIKRHKLLFDSEISIQQETIQSLQKQNKSIINRGILINPILYIAFDNYDDAAIAKKSMIKLTRNEDILLPNNNIYEMTVEQFDELPGFESFDVKEETDNSIWVGYDRYDNFKHMNIELKYTVNEDYSG